MADFEIAWGETEINEGGYVNDPVDAGGETYRGVTRRFHPQWDGWAIIEAHQKEAPDGFRELLDKDAHLEVLVRAVYRKQYWNPMRGDDFSNQHLANKVFDTGVNLGVARAIRYLQESLNLLNRDQKEYADIKVDGRVGEKTLSAMRAFLDLESGQADYLLKSISIMQGAHYMDVMRRDPRQQRFARGWLNRVGIR